MLPIIAGLQKKLRKIAAEGQCQDLKPWIKAIINHLYWAAASSEGQSGQVIVAKWKAVTNHICNVHKHEDPLFRRCLHPSGLRRKWLKKGKNTVVFYCHTIWQIYHVTNFHI